MSQVRPFPLDPKLTGIALAFRNKALIADAVLPRVMVGGPTFRYLKIDENQFFTIPNTLVGRKGRPNEVEFGATEVPGQVFDYGLDDVIPNDDIASAPQGFDPEGVAVQGLTDLVLLDREVRVSSLVFAAANYATGFKVTNAGGDQWDDPTSDPITQILDILETPLVRPNVAVLGQRVYDKLRVHPRVVAAAYPGGGNAGTGGIVTREALARVLEIERIEVGQAYVNTAKPGQAATVSRAWGNNAAFLHVNPLANTRTPQMSFGMTAQWQGRVAGRIAEPTVGLRGSVRVRVGESVNEIITANTAGYLVTDAVAAS